MKQLFTLCTFLSIYTVAATVKTTVASGSWFDPSTWNPAGVPLFEDTIVIAHDVTIYGNSVDFGANWLIVNSPASIVSDTIVGFHGNLRLDGLIDARTFAIGDGDSTLIYGTMDGDMFAAGNPININYGIVQCDSLSAGDDFDNYGFLNLQFFVTGGPAFINHTGSSMAVAGQCTFSADVNNQAGAYMVLGDLTTEGLLTNDGDITITNWTHGSGTATGTGGKFCITGCFVNADQISGTIDICDATPGTICDMDFGSIAATVTFCAVGPCSDNVGIDERHMRPMAFPNPTSGSIMVDNLQPGSFYELSNLAGQRIAAGVVEAEQLQLDLSASEAGIYLFKIYTTTGFMVIKVVKN